MAQAGAFGGLFRSSGIYLLGNLASRIVGFLAIPIYARFLSPTQYGIIELIELSTQVVAIAFGTQAVGTVMTRLFHDQDSDANRNAVVSTSLIATALVSAVVAVVAMLAAAPLSRAILHSTDNTPLLQAAFGAMFFSNLVEVILTYERIRDRARFFFWYSMVGLLVTLGLNIWFIGYLGAGVWGFVSSKLVVMGGGSVFLLWRAFGAVGWSWRGSLMRQLVHLGLPLSVASLSFFAIHFSDRFFLTAAVSLADLGRYALAYRFAFLVSVLVSDSFGKSWNVNFYRHVGLAGWREQFGHVARYLIFAECAAGLALCLTAPELFRIMVPPSFYPPALLLPVLVLAYVLRDVGDFFRNLLLINKRAVQIGRLVLAGAALNTALNFALIPVLGLYGAALATLATWTVYMVVFWVVACREHQIPSRPFSGLLLLALAGGVLAGRYAIPVPGLLGQTALDLGWLLLFTVTALPWYFSAADHAGMRLRAAAIGLALIPEHILRRR